MNIREKAAKWYCEHRQHVESLRKESSNAIYPGVEDCGHPELWKGIHWNWYFNQKEDSHGNE